MKIRPRVFSMLLPNTQEDGFIEEKMGVNFTKLLIGKAPTV
jgi:hypothetical protein